jgi:hypothetical protein
VEKASPKTLLVPCTATMNSGTFVIEAHPKEPAGECTHKCCSCKCYFDSDHVTKQGTRLTKDGTVDVLRCQLCNRVKNRVGLVFADGNGDLKKDWEKIDKATFNEKAKELYGDDLVKLIYDAIEEVTSSRFDVTFEGTGEFMDEEDMRAKYAAKPKRLDAILRNAKRIWDPTGEVELLEDMKYTSAKKATESHETKRKRSLDTEEKPKKPRQPKVKVEKKDDGEAAGEVADVKTLSEKQVAQIKAWKEQIELLQKTFEPITEQLSGTDDWLKHLPAWVTQKVEDNER